MTTENKRRHQRVDSLNLSYICVDENGLMVKQGMGRTLNVSESGICLETFFDIDTKYFLTLTIALQNILVDIRGKVAYCRSAQEEKFETGVEFLDLDQKCKDVLQDFIRLFHEETTQTD